MNVNNSKIHEHGRRNDSQHMPCLINIKERKKFFKMWKLWSPRLNIDLSTSKCIFK